MKHNVLGLLEVNDGLEFLLLVLKLYHLLMTLLAYHGLPDTLLQTPYFGFVHFLSLLEVTL
jgi:hypothetical protein